MSETKLEPCPFCGGDNLSIDEEWPDSTAPFFTVRCLNCEAQGPAVEHHRESAVNGWDRRAPAVNGRIEELERILNSGDDTPCVITPDGRVMELPAKPPVAAPGDVEPLLQRAREWIEAIDIRYGPSHYALAALLADVRAQERERCAKVCDELPTNKARCAELQLTEQAWEEATEACAAAIRGQK